MSLLKVALVSETVLVRVGVGGLDMLGESWALRTEVFRS